MAVLRVAVAGATGRTGRAVTRAVWTAPDLELVGALGLRHAGEDVGVVLWNQAAGVTIDSDVERMLDETGPDVLVEFTIPSLAVGHALAAAGRGISPVVGTTGLPEDGLKRLEEVCRAKGIGAVVIPNYSFGAMLLARFAEEAARVFKAAEIVEMHHERKLDAPSGTARALEARVREALGKVTPVHSVRLPGLVAHHRVIFGGVDETLVLEHNSLSRESFVAGVLLAVRKVRQLTGVVYRLDDLFPA